jgi:hypothetical protein
MKKILIAAAIAAMGLGTVATPTGALSYETFIGKGDVQEAFGWNNATMKANAGDVTFRAVDSTTTTQSCVDRERGVIIDTIDTVVRERSVEATLVYETRASGKSANVTGFNLVSVDDEERDREHPGCPMGYTPNGAPTFDRVSGLFASHNGVEVEI